MDSIFHTLLTGRFHRSIRLILFIFQTCSKRARSALLSLFFFSFLPSNIENKEVEWKVGQNGRINKQTNKIKIRG